MDEEDFVVTMRDIRAAKYCSGGARSFFAAHDLDWQDFLNNGIPASKLLATNDVMAQNLIRIARNGRQQ